MKSWQMAKTEQCREQVVINHKSMNIARIRAKILINSIPTCKNCQHCHPGNWLYLSGCPNWTPKDKT